MGDLDPYNIPMWDRTRNVAPTPKPAIVQPPLGDDFVIKAYLVKMIHERQFDGRVWADPYEHVIEFSSICGLFYGGTNMEEAVRLRLFPFSLTGESKNWYKELEPESITTWEQMREKFVRRFFPPLLAARLLKEIWGFQQHDSESLVEAWLRFKKMLRNCHGHGLSREQIIEIFYLGLDSQSADFLDASSGGIFLYKSANAAYQMLEDKVLFDYDLSRTLMYKPARRIAASVGGVGHYTVLVSKLDAFSRNLDNQLKSWEGEIKELQEGCGNHASIRCTRDDLCCSAPQKFVSMTSVEKMMSEFMASQNAAIDALKKQIENIKLDVEQNQNDQQASIQDIESKMECLPEIKSMII